MPKSARSPKLQTLKAVKPQTQLVELKAILESYTSASTIRHEGQSISLEVNLPALGN